MKAAMHMMCTWFRLEITACLENASPDEKHVSIFYKLSRVRCLKHVWFLYWGQLRYHEISQTKALKYPLNNTNSCLKRNNCESDFFFLYFRSFLTRYPWIALLKWGNTDDKNKWRAWCFKQAEQIKSEWIDMILVLDRLKSVIELANVKYWAI